MNAGHTGARALDGERPGRYPATQMARTAAGVLMACCLLGHGAAWAETAAAPLRMVSDPSGALELRAGDRRLAEVKLTTPAARRGEPRLSEMTVEGRRLVEVRTPIKGEDAAEVWVAAIGAAGANPVWSGRLGAVDSDGEVFRQIDAQPGGLFLYQTAARISSCDGKPVRLFQTRFDFATRRWKPAPPPLPPAAGAAIVARRGDPDVPAGRPRIGFPFTMSSAPPEGAPPAAAEVNHLVAPLSLNDGDPETVWAEGEIGDGRGEVLIARSASAGHSVVGLRLLPGDTRSPEQFAARARPQQLLVVLGPGPDQRFEVTLEERAALGVQGYRKPFWVPLPRPVASSCVTIVVRAVTPGADRRERLTSAWGDIDVFTELDGDKGVDRLVAAIEGPDCETRVPDVVAVGPAALPGLAAALGRAQGAPLDCVLDALGRLTLATPLTAEQSRPLSAALPAALRAVSSEQERALLTLMKRLREAPMEPLAALLRNGAADAPERTRAARALAALDRPDAWKVLVGQLGQGPAELRAVQRGLLAAAPPETARVVLADLRAAPRTETARRADQVWVLGSLAGRPGRSPEAEVGTLLATLAVDTKEEFEVRARALMALGSWADEAALAPLSQVRAGSPDAALRLVATRALAARADPAALAPLRAAVEDSDPGVRQVAVDGLASRRDRESTRLLIEAAKQEPWPAVRRAQVAALAQLCGPGATDLIVRAIERDVDEVRRAALRGLVSCKDPRAPRLLLGVLAQPREKPPLRTQAALLLAELKDPGTAPELATALERLLVEAQTDLALEATATGTLRALAEMGGPVALKAALRLRSDPRPVLRRSASEALGKLCDPGAGAEALRAATRDPDAAVAAAASAALRRCGSAQGTRAPKQPER
jgi:HEAT repeat protein